MSTALHAMLFYPLCFSARPRALKFYSAGAGPKAQVNLSQDPSNSIIGFSGQAGHACQPLVCTGPPWHPCSLGFVRQPGRAGARAVGLMDKASASGAGDSRLKSWAAHTFRLSLFSCFVFQRISGSASARLCTDLKSSRSLCRVPLAQWLER